MRDHLHTTVPRTVTQAMVRRFQKKILEHFRAHGRDLPWRRRPTPYRVLVSEIMLQQTQVGRVIEKYALFLEAFPDFKTLAQAPVPRLLRIWSGMGYNRRALALKALAQQVMDEHGGKLPADFEQLLHLPGIGKYTAGAVCAFAFNQPVVFLDTNVRRVFIHEFFQDRERIRDEELIPLIERTLYRENPRDWYNALMDYGTLLKQSLVNPNRRSAHYIRQSRFEGSDRQVRGLVVKTLLAASPLSLAAVVRETGMDKERVKTILARLADEGFIQKKGRGYTL